MDAAIATLWLRKRLPRLPTGTDQSRVSVSGVLGAKILSDKLLPQPVHLIVPPISSRLCSSSWPNDRAPRAAPRAHTRVVGMNR